MLFSFSLFYHLLLLLDKQTVNLGDSAKIITAKIYGYTFIFCTIFTEKTNIYDFLLTFFNDVAL